MFTGAACRTGNLVRCRCGAGHIPSLPGHLIDTSCSKVVLLLGYVLFLVCVRKVSRGT